MKKAVLTSLALLLLLLVAVFWQWGRDTAPALNAAAIAPRLPVPDSLLLTSTGLVGAGGEEPLLARVHGRVKRLYFAGGEYVHRGDVLVKLVNYAFVIAPRDGFLGPSRLTVGQYVTAVTPVTTLSRRRTLSVVLVRSSGLRPVIRPGDSVRVWVAARPTRVVPGVVGQPVNRGTETKLEILLGPGAPFRIGEQACVGRYTVRQLAARGAVAARPTRRE